MNLIPFSKIVWKIVTEICIQIMVISIKSLFIDQGNFDLTKMSPFCFKRAISNLVHWKGFGIWLAFQQSFQNRESPKFTHIFWKLHFNFQVHFNFHQHSHKCNHYRRSFYNKNQFCNIVNIFNSFVTSFNVTKHLHENYWKSFSKSIATFMHFQNREI